MIPSFQTSKTRHILRALYCLAIVTLLTGCDNSDDPPAAQQTGQLPVIRGNVSSATADKPQSKLWYAHDRWWAWLPDSAGSHVWSRNTNGNWSRDPVLQNQLAGLTGRGDVWADDNTVRAILVASTQLTIVTLKWNDTKQSYRLEGDPLVWPLDEPSSVETATITRDAAGHWWVAYDYQQQMWVRRSTNKTAQTWTEPIAVSQPAGDDDFCTIFTIPGVKLPGAVGLFWCDQLSDQYLFRLHNNKHAADDWEPIEVVASGKGIADDHLNAAVAENGTLYVTTRSPDAPVGQPQLTLHVRQPDGKWSAHKYGTRTATDERSRPIVFLSENSHQLHLCHAIYETDSNNKRTSRIAHLSVDAATLKFNQPETTVIEGNLPINSPTALKSPLPSKVAPLILASDGEGNVYEARLQPNN